MRFDNRGQAQFGLGVKDMHFFHVKADVNGAVDGVIGAVHGENLDRFACQCGMDKGRKTHRFDQIDTGGEAGIGIRYDGDVFWPCAKGDGLMGCCPACG